MIKSIPTNTGDITLYQYQLWDKVSKDEELTDLEKEQHKVAIFINVRYEDLNTMSAKTFKEVLSLVDLALSNSGKTKEYVDIHLKKFKPLKDLSKIKQVMYSDASKYVNNVSDWHRFMSVLCPCVENNKEKKYTNSSENMEYMKLIPLSYVTEMVGFFLTLLKTLNQNTQLSMVAKAGVQIKLLKHILLSGGGHHQYTK